MVDALKRVAPQTVGRSLAHDSSELHVQGTAIYIDDMREPEGLLHVYPGYAREVTRGTITELDLKKVQNAPEVVAVLTARDIRGVNDCSPSVGGDPILADGKIEFHGQVVFAVVAETREAARRAVRLARIEVAPERPAVTVDDAVAMATEDVGEPYAFARGDVAEALASAALSFGETFRIGGQEHFYLEGQVSLAVPEEHGGMAACAST